MSLTVGQDSSPGDTRRQRAAQGGFLPFRRPPRFRTVLETSALRLPAPPAPPAPISWRTVLPSIIASVAFAGVMAWQIGSSNAGAVVPIFVASLLLPISTVVTDRWAQYDAYSKGMTAYKTQLRADVVTATETNTSEAIIRRATDPSIESLLAAVRQHAVWERRPTHPDFLRVRWGVGGMPAQVGIITDASTSTRAASPTAKRATDKDLEALEQRLANALMLRDVPLTLDLRAVGSLGIVGHSERCASLGAALACHILAHHGPDDMRLAALYNHPSTEMWEWLKWVPHTQSFASSSITDRLLASDGRRRRHLSLLLREELTHRERARTEAAQEDSGPTQYLVVFIDARHAFSDGLDEALVEDLIARGPVVGLLTVVIAPTRNDLPSDCASLIEVPERGPAVWRIKEPPQPGVEAQPEQVDVTQALSLARALSPLSISTGSFVGKIPTRVHLLDVLNIDDAADADIWTMWTRGIADALQRRSPDLPQLRAPIGRDANGPVYLDLVSGSSEGGPHGILGGTTGSGKSELLRSMVLAFAATHHPHWLAFVLIDFKGGDAFAGLSDLPHVVGYITNLDEHEATRALDALDYERRARQVMLLKVPKEKADVTDYQKLREQKLREGAAAQDYPPLPNIVVVVDEFAELKDRIPGFIPRLTQIAQQGRSLGIHMLLATQRPGGAVNDDIRANTAYRICLRVTDARDSSDVIGSPQAALLSRTVPGRGYLRIGSDPIREFQSALSSTPYVTRTQRYTEDVRDFTPSVAPPVGVDTSNVQDTYGTTDLRSLVARLQVVAAEQRVQPLRHLILPALKSRIVLPEIPDLSEILDPTRVHWTWPDAPPTGWGSAPIGLLDRPDEQRQDALVLNLPRVGHAFICGSNASGRTTALHTLALALAATHRPNDLHLYAIDYGRAGLQPLQGLPHCGAIVHGGDTEQAVRLISELRRLGDERLTLLKRRSASTLTDYRRQTGQRVPYIVVLVDNFSMFHDVIASDRPDLSRQRAVAVQSQLASLFREGPALGIHFVLTDTTWRILRAYPTLTGALGLRLALHQIDEKDYAEVGVSLRSAVSLPPGRGFVSGAAAGTFQIALPLMHRESKAPDEATAAQTAFGVALHDERDALDAFYTAINAAAETRAPGMTTLPESVTMEALRPASSDGQLTPGAIGLADRTIRPFAAQLEPAVLPVGSGHAWQLIAGPVESGKTTLLYTMLLQLMLAPSAPSLAVVAPHRSILSKAAHSPIVLTEQVDPDFIARLKAHLAARQPGQRAAHLPSLVVLIDDLHEIMVRDLSSLNALVELSDQYGQLGFTVIAAGLTKRLSTVSTFEHTILRRLREARSGVLLCPQAPDDGTLFGLTGLPLAGSYPAGRGFLIEPGGYKLIQVAQHVPPKQ